jgi:hypothetical protein
MATMIPDKLPLESSVGEKRMFSCLQNLDDDCIVYYEPIVRRRYPDFIVIIPDVGVLVIEVKGWYPAWIKQADAQDIVVHMKGQDIVEAHPARQARDYMNKLRDECREHQSAGTLINPVGPRAGSFIFPFGHVAVLSNITATQLSEREGMARVFSSNSTITRDKLDEWLRLDGAALKAELAACFDPSWPFPPMTQQQIDVLRSVIHPTIIIGPKPTPIDLKVMDLRQESNARSIGDGHRVFYGVAGSGKTVLLIGRAKLLADDENRLIIVLCFNKVLAKYLKSSLRDKQNIHVHHFHEWGKNNGEHFRKNVDVEDYGDRLLRRLERGEGDAGRYDAVLIDEAQDFACSWFKCAKLALKEPNDGDLVIVGDGSQSLYANRTFSWADAGIQARGRTINRKLDLDKNYRNTVEILSAAHSFAGSATEDNEDSAIRKMAIVPTTAVRRGPWPLVVREVDPLAVVNEAVNLIRHWLKDGVEISGVKVQLTPNDVGILYPRLVWKNKRAFQHLCDQLNEYGTVLLSGQNSTGSPSDEGIKITTIHSAKGLQFRAVILLWADLLPSNLEERDDAAERMLFYVALTRAEDVVAVIHSGSSSYVNEIERNIAAARGEG